MSKIKELEVLLKTDVLIEVEEEIVAIEKLLEKNSSNKNLKIELEYMQDVKKFYNEALNQIDKGLLTEEEANNILLDLEDMREDDEDEI
ncbi:hypothetical protein [Aliarcobacter cibarius]|uniref:Uncharacterized protein n=1 Tax=Aliarcobacter cibarius TaxID=255507 RepID=A0A5J6RH79_9BACT|nr:hypothetical protein [Aliarcobacter cibarius]QEZ89275.1 hypothetical protein ACIB15232_1162 [Aliarcobacter cibarius]QKJ27308.1 hypothetical protein ACBT_1402 [Aliarcobacter cibarius]TLS95379.1 hypothetical protein FE247_11090 [Aliarcobacter cibarius]TLS95863.1 hypothetical protein FE245_11155 [Aliarcobacter cibarius]TLT02997.1 hypothetical protein FE248_08460 [Aliarcobacter cibarius]